MGHVRNRDSRTDRRTDGHTDATVFCRAVNSQSMPKGKDSLFSESTWLRLGIQMMHGLKSIHDVGFIHR